LSRLESGDEQPVRGAVLAGGGVDTGDPQLAELAFASPAVPVGIRSGMHDLLVGGPKTATTSSLVSLGLVEHLAVSPLGRDAISGACHRLPPGVTCSAASSPRAGLRRSARPRRCGDGTYACPWPGAGGRGLPGGACTCRSQSP